MPRPSITNNQEANVDEGDIVKQHGDILVVLRRGRLFTISLAHGGMHAVDSINAYPPGVDASGDWYDEMLVSNDRIVVIGYSYSRGGTQVNRFHLMADGHLGFEDAYQLRSNDYYSSRNYASRMIGSKLIFYTPLYLSYSDADPFASLPALRRWTGDKNAKFERIVSARHVYIPGVLKGGQIDRAAWRHDLRRGRGGSLLHGDLRSRARWPYVLCVRTRGLCLGHRRSLGESRPSFSFVALPHPARWQRAVGD